MKHADLIDRLKADHGADRELDAEIYCAFNAGSKLALIDGKSLGFVNTAEMQLCKAGHYTESLDACIGLMREVLPGWVIVTLTNGMIDPKYMDVREYVSWRVCLAPKKHMEDPMECIGWPDVYHTDLPRALLIAILQAADGGNGDGCDHEWIDARNSVVESGEICLKCNSIRATPESEGE